MSNTVKMKREDAASFSFGGKEFKADKAGVIEMSEDAARAAAEHGFERVPEAKKAKADKAD
jgi:hypothetical protein